MTESPAERLWTARRNGRLVPRAELGAIATMEQAYRAQSAQADLSGQRVAGWKIGAASDASMRALGFDEPFVGPVLDGFVYDSGGAVPLFVAHGPRLETELAVTLGADLAPRSGPYSLDDVKAAVGSVSASFEIVALRLEGGADGYPHLLVADGGGNEAIVLGQPYDDWAERDLRKRSVTVSVNGAIAAEGGNQALIWDDPLDALVYLANHRAVRERGLRAGDVVMTGTWAGALPIKPGDTATADFGDIGTVTARFVPASP